MQPPSPLFLLRIFDNKTSIPNQRLPAEGRHAGIPLVTFVGSHDFDLPWEGHREKSHMGVGAASAKL
jgi:hypothetical protein